ncbi:MAG TPA: post-COAP-1 domain-containing protein [Nitrospirales bacterium]|jgi:hypothetical protein
MNTRASSKLRWALGIITVFLLWPSVNFAQVAISYSGDGVAGKGIIGGTTFEFDRFSLPSTGGDTQNTIDGGKSFPTGAVPPAVCINCIENEKTFTSVQGSGPYSMTETDVDSVVLVIGGHTIRVNSMFNNTSAVCPSVLGDPAGVVPNTYVGYVNIDPDSPTLSFVATNVMDSQTFPLGGVGANGKGIDGTVSVNRLASFSSIAAGGDIVVNSIQVDMATGDQVVIGSSHAGVMCPTAPDGGGVSGGCPGKVTGGGMFMLGGKRQTFGFVAGTKKDGTAFGNFNYVNHGTGAHLQGSVQRVSIDTKTATITGTLKSGDAYTLVVVDNGEPGRADTFNLTSTPLTTGGPIALDPRGGNIQVHRGCSKK